MAQLQLQKKSRNKIPAFVYSGKGLLCSHGGGESVLMPKGLTSTRTFPSGVLARGRETLQSGDDVMQFTVPQRDWGPPHSSAHNARNARREFLLTQQLTRAEH